jgi:hypothetical protein
MAVTVALDRLGMKNWMGRWDGYKEDGMEERRRCSSSPTNGIESSFYCDDIVTDQFGLASQINRLTLPPRFLLDQQKL